MAAVHGRALHRRAGGPLRCNGVEQQSLEPAELVDAIIGIGTFNVEWRGRFPGRYRLAVLEHLSRVSSRVRIHGATGVDLAYTAAGILGGAVSFGDHIWDHAAGVALVRAAGGIVTDLAGRDWTPSARAALAGVPGCHGQILEILDEVGPPESY